MKLAVNLFAEGGGETVAARGGEAECKSILEYLLPSHYPFLVSFSSPF